jgi:hypothetical protein
MKYFEVVSGVGRVEEKGCGETRDKMVEFIRKLLVWECADRTGES